MARRRKRLQLPHEKKSRPHWKHLWWILPLLVADVFLFRWLLRDTAPATPPKAIAAPALPSPASPWTTLRFPTDQARLLDGPDTPGVFQPTASGRPVSALYGSVRTAEHGGSLMASFHEGVDIAAMARDRHGRPLDAICAAADGRVAHVNRIAGNSNYGIYVVLLHDDPSLGEVFTLYAHLASAEKDIRPGTHVHAGRKLGVMGNTSSSPIPMVRAHLHFEIGLLMNSRYAVWYRANKLRPDHGNYHGRNLFGLDPLAFFAMQRDCPSPEFKAYVTAVPIAFELVLRAKKRPDFFARYPVLWDGAPYSGNAIHLAVSENGVPLRGRNATDDETAALGRKKSAVLRVNEAALGRNGSRLVRRDRRDWRLASNGDRWLEIVTF